VQIEMENLNKNDSNLFLNSNYLEPNRYLLNCKTGGSAIEIS